MPDEIYEIIALAARYWFLFLMILIAWRSYRWYTRDRKKFKRRLKLLPDAGYVGELVVVEGDGVVRKGTCLPVSREGVLGYLRSNDVCLPVNGVANRHLWFVFDDTDGLQVEPFRGRAVVADGQELIGKRMRAFLCHGSALQVGEAKMRLRMFAGFEYAGEADARRRPLDEQDELEPAETLEAAPQSGRVRRMHEIAAWETLLEEEDAAPSDQAFYPPEMDDEEDMDDDAFLPPMDEAGANVYELQDGSQVFYPPVTDDDPAGPDGGLPKSAYVDEDEAERAKRVLWDKYFKGGRKP